MSEPKKPQSKKILDAVDKGEQIAEAAKDFTPPEVDAIIDRGVTISRTAKTVIALKSIFGGFFGGKK